MGISTFVKEKRKEKHLKQRELANRSAISLRNIQLIEAGQCAPSVETALRLARFLGVSVEELFILND